MKPRIDSTFPVTFDVAVIGAGHAGIEAALASARLGCSTVIFTINLDNIGFMPCNPSVGGIGKGHLVRELDALGGLMGVAADATGLQYRMLNTKNGPSVQAPRIQSDKKLYSSFMKTALEKQANLQIMQDLIDSVETDGHGKITGLISRRGVFYRAHTVVITAGTYMNGLIHVGLNNYKAGRADEFASEGLPQSLLEKGLVLKRLKTGTPARVNRSSVDFSRLERQDGDVPPPFFSYRTKNHEIRQLPCWLTHTTEKTRDVVLKNLDRSPLYGKNKVITGTGARYCPSFEDKVVRFQDKVGHHVFLEPEGLDTDEMYVNGTSNSLPEDVQWEMLRTIPGLENVNIMRVAYAIEYDYVDPTQLDYNFECRKVPGLFLAGQVNGTSGYEEAAVQGFMAGVNAALKVRKEEPFILKRSEAYIGVLCDDLVSKGIDEPYRIFTSRAEYRLLLRYDNADMRLMAYGRKLGLVGDEVWEQMKEKYDVVEKLRSRLDSLRASPALLADLQNKKKLLSEKSFTLKQLLVMPDIDLHDLESDFPEGASLDPDTRMSVEVGVKYEGYIKRQAEDLERLKKVDDIVIPPDLDVMALEHLPLEVKEKLLAVKPKTLGQARSLSAVSDSDLTMLYLEIRKRGARDE